jgi:hypothetical protein
MLRRAAVRPSTMSLWRSALKRLRGRRPSSSSLSSRLAGRGRSPAPGRRAQRAHHDGAHRHAEGSQPERRAGVQFVPQIHAVGKAQAEAGRMSRQRKARQEGRADRKYIPRAANADIKWEFNLGVCPLCNTRTNRLLRCVMTTVWIYVDTRYNAGHPDVARCSSRSV